MNGRMGNYEDSLIKTYNKLADELRPVGKYKISPRHAEELAEYYDFPMDKIEELFEIYDIECIGADKTTHR